MIRLRLMASAAFLFAGAAFALPSVAWCNIVAMNENSAARSIYKGPVDYQVISGNYPREARRNIYFETIPLAV